MHGMYRIERLSGNFGLLYFVLPVAFFGAGRLVCGFGLGAAFGLLWFVEVGFGCGLLGACAFLRPL